MFGGVFEVQHARQMNGIRVVLLGSNGPFRQRVQAIIGEEGSYSIVGCATSWKECEALVADHLPEILIAETGLLPIVLERSDFPVILHLREASQIDPSELEQTLQDFRHDLQRVRYELYSRKACELSTLLERYLEGLNSFNYLSSLKASQSGQNVDVPVAQIQVIEASGNYVRIYASGKILMMREAISCLQGKLDPSIFVRVHRSYLVNIHHVSHLSAPEGAAPLLFLQDGNTIHVGPNYRDGIVRLFECTEKLTA